VATRPTGRGLGQRQGDGMTEVLELRPNERVVIDSSCLERLCRRMGPRGAEGYLGERVEEISERLADIDWLARQGLMAEVPADALRVARLCGEIGLASLARAARDLAQVAQRGDPAAWGAVWERVVRIGDRSLAQVWDAPGLTV
jgi:hypothetical protein